MPAFLQPAGLQGGDGADRKHGLLMWGYLPAASLHRSPLTQPTPSPPPALGQTWTAACGGGCGFAVAISDSGKIHTWGSATDLGHAQLSSERQVRPEPFPLPETGPFVGGAAGWAHCVAITSNGEVYTWGWSECVPEPKPERDLEEPVTATGKACRRRVRPELAVKGQARDVTVPFGKDRWHDDNESASSTAECGDDAGGFSGQGMLCPLNTFVSDGQRDSTSIRSRSRTWGSPSKLMTSKASERAAPTETGKKRRLANVEEPSLPDSSPTCEESISAPPCLVNLGLGVRIVSVAAGGRHTLALSDTGHVWGWGYGGEGQLGLGSRLRTVSSPQAISFFQSESQWSSGRHCPKFPGSRITAIACGGRHSAVITDAGALLTFGWGLYGQCGQGSTEDELSPVSVEELAGLRVTGIAAGLWHTLCVTDCGSVYAFGGNQFGQLGVGGDHAEMMPKLVEARLEEEVVVSVDCGARHSVVLTDGGKVFSWGWNKYGQLGLGDTADRDTPAQIQLGDIPVKCISCGWWHTLAVTQEARLLQAVHQGVGGHRC